MGKASRLLLAPLKLYRNRHDPLLNLRILREIGAMVIPEYRFKWPQLDWWQDEEFDAYLERFGELSGLNTDRRWMLSQLLRLTTGVAGDTAECGVFEGSSSYLICKANAMQPVFERTHYAFDSYEGLSQPGMEDGSHWTPGDLWAEVETVRSNLAGFTRVEIMKGWIPERFPEVAECRFAFVHIDVDLEQPTRDSIEFFYPRMNSGGIIVCDDYGFSTCPGATRAIDSYLGDKPEKMLAMSGGGGFLIAGCQTGP